MSAKKKLEERFLLYYFSKLDFQHHLEWFANEDLMNSYIIKNSGIVIKKLEILKYRVID